MTEKSDIQQRIDRAVEQATSVIAQSLRDYACVVSERMTTEQVLIGFAKSIERQNAKRYPKGPQS